MERIILTDIPVSYDPEAIAATAHIRKESDMYEDLEAGAPLAKAAVKARAVLKQFPVDSAEGDTVTIAGTPFQSKTVCDAVAGQPYVYLGVVSAGEEISALDDIEDEIVAYYLETNTLKQACDATRAYLNEHCGYQNADFFEPGSIADFAIENNQTVFTMLGTVTEDIGVVLRDSGFMKPTITLSGIFYDKK
ncbi:MAG: hypothetical protein ACC608_06495 [Anaerofustis sp.]